MESQLVFHIYKKQELAKQINLEHLTQILYTLPYVVKFAIMSNPEATQSDFFYMFYSSVKKPEQLWDTESQRVKCDRWMTDQQIDIFHLLLYSPHNSQGGQAQRQTQNFIRASHNDASYHDSSFTRCCLAGLAIGASAGGGSEVMQLRREPVTQRKQHLVHMRTPLLKEKCL